MRLRNCAKTRANASAPAREALMLLKASRRIAAASLPFAAGIAIVAGAEEPAAPEHKPPSGIPDTQVFVSHSSPLGFRIKVPEGWSRAEEPQSVRFSDKYDRIEIDVSSLGSAPTIDTANAGQVPELVNAGRAVKAVKVKQVELKGGSAVLVAYTSNFAPNPMTNKQVRLEPVPQGNCI
jgi:hypothetical protein